MCVDHATVGRRVAHLEASIGKKLVARLPRSTRLPEEGKPLADIAQGIEEKANAVVRHLINHADAMPVTITVRALPPLCTFLIAPALPRFAEEHPEIHIVFSAASAVAYLE